MNQKQVNDREFEAVSVLDGAARYRHLVAQAADWCCVWCLRTVDGWVIYGDDRGRELIPIWPHQRYASACAVMEWSDCEPSAVPVDELIESWLPGMEANDLLVAAFPVPTGRGVAVAPGRFREDLMNELQRYE